MSSAFGSFGSSGAPGNLTPFDTSVAQAGLGQSISAMENRYNQLGLGSQGATPTSPGGGRGLSTAALMDYGALPSLTGGEAQQFQALLGQLQNQAVSIAPGGSGKTTNPLNALGSFGNK